MSALLALSLLLTTGTVQGATIVVNDSGDTLHSGPGDCALTGTGTCTLRDAITFANANPGRDGIIVGIGGNGTISIGAGGLPPISEEVGLSGNLVVGRARIEGTAAGAADGLTISANGSTISNLEIAGFGGAGIRLTGSGNTIGGYCMTACAGGGVILSGNGSHGLLIEGGASNVVGNCRIESNGGDGVHLGGGATGNLVGGLFGFLGCDITGNAGAGVRIGDSAGDTATTGNRVTITTIHDNGGLGIDLGGDGVSANDAQDPDAGPNTLQNFPVLTEAISSQCEILVRGSLNSTPATTFEVEVFVSVAQDPSGHGEGETRLGTFPVTTDAQGDATFAQEFPFASTVGAIVTATATAGSGGTSGTSEFSQAIAIALPTASGPLEFFSVPPCRVLDTRGAPGPWGGPALVELQRREFQVAGQCGVPADAKAVSVNVTVVDPGDIGQLAVYSAESARDCTSTVSFRMLKTRANNAIIGLGAGRIWMYSTAGTHAILDVNGYFR